MKIAFIREGVEWKCTSLEKARNENKRILLVRQIS